jgi:predicted dehydrogenase
MHGPVAIAAMQRGKHVYCQKPLAHNLRECRRMQELAAQRGLVTQMGIQIHAHEAYRTAMAALQAGAIGKVRSMHAWVGRSWAGLPGGRPAKQDPVPAGFDWDLWLGVAPTRPFVKDLYHPANWRGWCDFGTGTLGDMGCHILDPVFSALEPGAPVEVLSRGPQHGADAFVGDESVSWTFPANERTAGQFTVHWTDGSARPDVAAAHVPDSVKLGDGSFVIGELGVMVLPHWAMPQFYQCGKVLEVAVPKEEARNHYQEWTDACRGEGRTSTPFAYSAPLSETVLAGTVAGRFKDRLLRWDSKALRFDHEPANAFVGREYRKGWEPA